MSLAPLVISLKVAVVATILAFGISLACAGFVRQHPHVQGFADTVFALPFVLPPTVVGFLLLVCFGQNSVLGRLLKKGGVHIVFTWKGAVLAAVAVSVPIIYQAMRSAFDQFNQDLVYDARTLGMSERAIFLRLVVPLSWRAIRAGVILAFARALGEFGATMMLAGNIPGKTQTMSVALYTAVQSGNRALAYQWVGIMLGISIVTIVLMRCLFSRVEAP